MAGNTSSLSGLTSHVAAVVSQATLDVEPFPEHPQTIWA